ncbi:MAG: aminomethyl-transferring glycine dehydrogenase subunit GcvPA [Clostridia bacterium]
MRYIPHTQDDVSQMLQALAVPSIDALFDDIPEGARLKRPLDIPGPLTEMEIQTEYERRAARNVSSAAMPSYLGGQFYDRFVPAAVAALAFRGEFATAYTPYQPELSQGTLAAIFEFQSMIAGLTGMHAAQASMYDGASAVGEAALLALGATGRPVVVLDEGVFPDVESVVRTYVTARGGRVERRREQPWAEVLTRNVAAVILSNPDVFGTVRNWSKVVSRAHEVGALAVASVEPVSLALVRPPGEMGFDVAAGEGQPLGNHLQYGGPSFGFFAVSQALMRRLPGRLVGMTHDVDGRRGFVLTLQAREQHIRRERATSNICSNHSLNALQATIYLALLGPEGLRELARLSAAKAHYLVSALEPLGIAPARPGPFLFEVALALPRPADGLNRHLLDQGIVGGYDMSRWRPEWAGLWQVAVTEKRTRAELDTLIEEVRRWISR